MRRFILFISVCALLAAALIFVLRAPFSGPRMPAPRPAGSIQIDATVATMLSDAADRLDASRGTAMDWNELAIIYEAHELFELSRDCYEEALDLDPSIAQSWYHLALVREQLGDLDGAIDAMTRAHEQRPDYTPSSWRIGFWSLQRNEIDDAAKWFETARGREPDNEAAQFGLARVHLARQEMDAAIDTLQPLADAPGRNRGYARLLLADALRRSGQPVPDGLVPRGSVHPHWTDPWAAEVRQFQRSYGAQFRRAIDLLSAGQTSEALAMLQTLHAQRPDDADVIANLGVALLRSGQPEAALTALEEGRGASPDHPSILLNLAAACLRVDDLDAALAHADHLVDRHPTLAAGLEVRGMVLLRLQRPLDAIDSLTASLALEAGRTRAQFGLAEALIEAERWDEASDLLTELRAGVAESDRALLGALERRLATRESAAQQSEPSDDQTTP